jgi:hypothetical protein
MKGKCSQTNLVSVKWCIIHDPSHSLTTLAKAYCQRGATKSFRSLRDQVLCLYKYRGAYMNKRLSRIKVVLISLLAPCCHTTLSSLALAPTFFTLSARVSPGGQANPSAI